MIAAQRTTVTADGIAIYAVQSRAASTVHSPVVNLETGAVDCSCPDYTYRKYPAACRDGVTPDIGSVKYHCKHIESAIRDCLRNGEIRLNL